MVKVFLVEDEIVVRNGIKQQINWETEGLEFIGEASDGELAFPEIQQLKPDIVITDIKMPFMDGLELSKLIKKEIPWIKIIILSGYDEFKYAKEAISIGVTEYLLKPIGSTELLSAVVRVRNIIYEEQTEKENVEFYRQEMLENEKNKRENFFFNLVSKDIPIVSLMETGKELGIDLAAQRYNIILTNVFIKEKSVQGETIEVLHKITDLIEKQGNVIVFDRKKEGNIYLLKGTSQASIEAGTNKIIECFKEVLKDYSNIEYFIGVGLEVNRLSELNECFISASKAFSYRYFVEKNQVIDSKNLNDYRIVRDSGIDIKSLDVNKLNKTIVESFLKTGSKNEVRHFLKEYFGNIGEKNISSYLFFQYVIFDLYFSCISIMEELGLDSIKLESLCGNPQNVIKSNFTLEDAVDFLEKVFQTVMEFRNTNSDKKYNDILMKAKEFINQNIASEDISLNTVANQVNISASHFSTIFSHETGQNFIDYLTAIRMKKAKELLRCSNMKSSEIGYAVGYKDPHYFSFQFKKTQGITPKEYRLKGRN